MNRDYSKTVIYKITSAEDPSWIYVGHTTDYYQRRKYYKKHSAEKSKCMSPFNYIHAYGGWDKVIMEKVENYPCDFKQEADERTDYIKKLHDQGGAKSNFHKKAYRYAIKDKVSEYNKRYYSKKKENTD